LACYVTSANHNVGKESGYDKLGFGCGGEGSESNRNVSKTILLKRKVYAVRREMPELNKGLSAPADGCE
jgi:hypothetical protein